MIQPVALAGLMRCCVETLQLTDDRDYGADDWVECRWCQAVIVLRPADDVAVVWRLAR